MKIRVQKRNKMIVLLLAFILLFNTLAIAVLSAEEGAIDNFKVTNLKTKSNIDRNVEISWDPTPGAAGYYIFRMFDGDSSMPYIAYTMNTSYSEVPQKGGFVYYLVIPFKLEGKKQIQGSYDINTYSYTAPPAIENLSSQIHDNEVDLRWTPSQGATEYVIKRRGQGDTEEAVIAKTRANVYTDELPRTDVEVTYFYNVYPVYASRGIELQGQNKQYTFQTYIPKEEEEPTVPSEQEDIRDDLDHYVIRGVDIYGKFYGDPLKFVDYVNEHRKNHSQPEVIHSQKITYHAKRRCLEEAYKIHSGIEPSHTRLDGSLLLIGEGGENLRYGWSSWQMSYQDNEQESFEAWKASPGHNRHMLYNPKSNGWPYDLAMGYAFFAFPSDYSHPSSWNFVAAMPSVFHDKGELASGYWEKGLEQFIVEQNLK